MKLVIDENIPQAQQCFGRFGKLSVLPGRAIDAAALRDAEVLIVRSVTRVDRALLEGSRVRFVGSTTAGTDHVAQAELAAMGIHFAHAPGSNADSVVDYVLSCLALAFPGEENWSGLRIGIVGCGNVGSRLLARARALGASCRICDPLLQGPVPGVANVPLENLLDSDVLTLHVPLSREGAHATLGMIGEAQLRRMSQDALLINSARGPVLDNAALLQLLRERPRMRAVLDVWQHEPHVDMALLARLMIATPHIAGYAADGKLRGVSDVYRALCAFLGEDAAPAGVAEPSLAPAGALHAGVLSWQQAVLACYDVRGDDARMRAALLGAEAGRAAAFDRLRRDYPSRREFSAWRLGDACATQPRQRAQLLAAGFAP